MSISEADVRHVATLARLGIDASRIPSLVQELNGILVHMEVLQRVTLGAMNVDVPGASEMPLRDDVTVDSVAEAARAAIAPALRDGFFLVPRLDTHGTVTPQTVLDAPDAPESA